MDASGLLHRDLTEQVISAFYDTYNALGHGFLESVYENAYSIELRRRGLRVEVQKPIVVWFREQVVGEFRADLIVENQVLVEIKAAAGLLHVHEAQLINYPKATGMHVGLLVNFGPRPQFRRRVF